MSGGGNFIVFSELKKGGKKERKGKVLLIDVAAQMQPFQLASMKSLLRNLCSITLLISSLCGSFFFCFFWRNLFAFYLFSFLACFPGAAHGDKLNLWYHVKGAKVSNVRPDRTPGELIIDWVGGSRLQSEQRRREKRHIQSIPRANVKVLKADECIWM